MKRVLLILGLLAIIGGAAFYVFLPLGGELPSKVVTALKESEQMTLYSIDPGPLREYSLRDIRFHGYRILGETVISSTETREQVARAIRKGVKAWDGNRYSCFNPRHALRVVRGAVVYDLLICFECQGVEIFDGELSGSEIKMHETATDSTGIAGPAGVLDDLLRAAHVPLELPPLTTQ